MDSGGGADPDAPVIHDQSLAIWAWSSVSFDEAHSAYEAFFDAFERQRLTSSEVFALFFEGTAVIENYDELAQVYSVTARWTVTLIDRT
jgi:hypothetical protein